MMRNAGVVLPDPLAPASASEQMTADSLGLTVAEVRFSRRIGVAPEKYAAAKSIRSLADFEAVQAETIKPDYAGG